MRQRNPEANCGNCPYWAIDDDPVLSIEDDKLFGSHFAQYCHRYPPVTNETVLKDCDMSGYGAIFPVTASDDWCGEHPAFWLEEADDSGTRMATAKVTHKEGD